MPDDLPSRSPRGPIVRSALRAWRAIRSMFAPPASTSIAAAARGGRPAMADFNALKAMSAMARFPTVYACASAVSEDLARLPIRVLNGPGPGAKPVEDHPILELLEDPAAGLTERRLRMQLYTDESLTRNAFWWFDGSSMRRLHPRHAQPVLDDFGAPVVFRYGQLEIPARQVYWVSGPSWADDARMAFGTSPIMPLSLDLSAIYHAKRHAMESSSRGRPDMHFSASEDSLFVADEALQRVVDRYEEITREGKAAFFTAGGFKAEQLSWSPRDLEYAGVHDRADSSVMMVMGVPAVRLGIPNANYGEAKVQMRMYWERLLARARGFDDALTRQARRMDSSPAGLRVVVRHDATDVEALQPSFDQRQVRAGNWIAIFGMSAKDAARVEGFDREAELIPEGPAPGKVPRRPREDPDEQQERRQALRLDLQRYFALMAHRLGLLYDRDADDPEWQAAERAEEAGIRALLEDHGVEAAEALAGMWVSAVIQVARRRRATESEALGSSVAARMAGTAKLTAPSV